MFTSKVTVDLGTTQSLSQSDLQDKFHEQLNTFHRLGSVHASTEDFTFSRFIGKYFAAFL